MSIPVVDALDLDALEPGTTHRFWLELMHDGLGEPVRAPVLVARGATEGPIAGLTAAVHGNEVNGVPVIHGLFAHLDPQRLRGTVVAVPVVNVPAYLLHQRRTDDGFDLNHLFPGKPHGREALVLAHRVFDRVVRKVDLLLDLHTASFGRVNCLYVRADMRSPDTARMALLQRPEIVVHNPPSDGTLRGAAAAAGIPAITVEIGNPGRLQRELVRNATSGVRAVLSDRGMLPRRSRAAGDAPVVCESSEWLYTDSGGFLHVLPKVTDRVARGELVARLVDAFGDVRAEYHAPWDGVVIGKNVDPVANTGARILHLGRVADARGALSTRAQEVLAELDGGAE